MTTERSNKGHPPTDRRLDTPESPTPLKPFCHACQAIPAAGYCRLPGCPMPTPPEKVGEDSQGFSSVASASPSGGDGWCLVDDGPPVTLGECPPGLFRLGEYVGLKTEYGMTLPDGETNCPGDQIRWKVSNWPDAYVVASGEVWWGGATKHHDRAELVVQPCSLERETAPPPSVGEVQRSGTTEHKPAEPPSPAAHAELLEALTYARDLFAEYERLHLAKVPPDYGKAHRNCLAKTKCDMAIHSAQAQPVAKGELEPDWAISKDGPNLINTHRRWLARQLMDSRLTADEAFNIVAHSPAITEALAKAKAHTLGEAS